VRPITWNLYREFNDREGSFTRVSSEAVLRIAVAEVGSWPPKYHDLRLNLVIPFTFHATQALPGICQD
jgi:hypothetical protein